MNFGDDPIQQNPFPKKTLLIIAGGVVLALCLIGAVFFLTRTKEVLPETSSATVFQKPTESFTTDPCSVAGDSEACRAAGMKQKAVEEKNADACTALGEGEKEDCFWSVARAAKDALVCERMADKDLAARCAHEQYVSQAVQMSDPALCDKIGETGVRDVCKAVVQSAQGVSCEAASDECVLARVLKTANEQQDADLCKILPGAEAPCRAGVLVNDPDRDGLDSTQEIILYGTDPRKADTDADGYPDGEEVRSGYDPLKK